MIQTVLTQSLRLIKNQIKIGRKAVLHLAAVIPELEREKLRTGCELLPFNRWAEKKIEIASLCLASPLRG